MSDDWDKLLQCITRLTYYNEPHRKWAIGFLTASAARERELQAKFDAAEADNAAWLKRCKEWAEALRARGATSRDDYVYQRMLKMLRGDCPGSTLLAKVDRHSRLPMRCGAPLGRRKGADDATCSMG